MSEMSETIELLQKCAGAISSVADWLSEQYEAKEAPIVSKPIEQAPTLESVRAVLASKSRAGFTAQIRALLLKYGAEKLSAIDPANYKALLAEAEELSDAT